jgi:hypothetical protein
VLRTVDVCSFLESLETSGPCSHARRPAALRLCPSTSLRTSSGQAWEPPLLGFPDRNQVSALFTFYVSRITFHAPGYSASQGVELVTRHPEQGRYQQ